MRILSLVFLAVIIFPIQARDCVPTPAMTPGTHYKPVTLNKIDIGKGLLVQGSILSSKDCKPVAGARIAHWQAGKNGSYQDRLRAFLYSDENGRYRFSTEWPAAMVPHIHFIVSANGYRKVGTQWIGEKNVESIKFDIVLKPNSIIQTN